MSNSTAVMASSVRFYLEGHSAMPSGTVVHKFQNAMITARKKLTDALAAVSATPINLTAAQELVLYYCFNAADHQRAATFTKIKATLKATLDGLATADLKICEPYKSDIPSGAEGYVTTRLGIKGSIHTLFDLTEARTAHNLVHEATHKFCDTLDQGYIGNSIGDYLRLRGMGISGNSPITNVKALDNADSYAAFALHLT